MLSHKNEEASAACEYLAGNASLNVGLPSNEDLYLTLTAFLECAEQQRVAQNELGKEVLQFRLLAMKEECTQEQHLQKLLEKFVTACNTLSNSRRRLELGPATELDTLDLSYRPDHLLGEDIKAVVRSSLGMEP